MSAARDLTDTEILELKLTAASLVSPHPDAQMAVSIMRTLGKHLSDADWLALYRGLPFDIVPLTPRQLEALRGGYGLSDWIPFPVPELPW